MDIGYRMICEEGIENVGVREISEAAGVTTGTFYYYFKSKEDLIWNYAGERTEFIDGFKSLKSKGAYDRIMELFLGTVIKVMEMDGCDNVIRILSRKKTNAGLYSFVLSIVKEGIETGEFTAEKTAEDLTTFILDSYRGATFAWYRSSGEEDLVNLFKEHIGFSLEHFLT
ncbi:MAG: helix-turn-helix transcriptional regulator [Firmicutes bacterium]|nr:helix-turn-helix transcriptional regulator [Bacillota bacterium]